jgi:hypothetical protein
MTRRAAMAIVALVVLLLLMTLYTWGHLAAKRAGAMLADAELRECDRTASEIQRISRRPQLASEQERMSEETTGLIERVAKAAGIDVKSILRITPGSPQRIGDTVYKEKPTRILLKDVTLEQLTKLMHTLASSPQALQPKSVRLSTPNREDTGNLWGAEIEVTYLIYDPLRLEKVRSIQ